MSDEARQWPRVKALFDGALNLSPEQRAAFLDVACGSDVGVRGEVVSLLTAHAEGGSFAEGEGRAPRRVARSGVARR